jgi:amidohydrolase
MDFEEMKKNVQAQVEAHRHALIDLSMKIHANPELGWKEEKASNWLADYLEENDFNVSRGICDLPTAFVASYGKGKPSIGLLAEYDALPSVGHGCGHNIISTAAVGAAMALKPVSDKTDAKIMVFGCPAEELLGGKVIMAEKGAFDKVDFAMQIHPVAGAENWAGFESTACIFIDVEFFGKETHAAANPWDGVSALEAMIQSFNHINSLRLHLRDKGRISGIITDGGEAVNVIPAHAAGTFQMRATEDSYLDELKGKVLNCIEAAAQATGCRLEYRWGMRCNAMQTNKTLLAFWKKNMKALSREVGQIVEVSGSTDTGNVSVTVPTIHAFLSISKETLPFHSTEFREAACSDYGQQAIIDGAKALSMTGVDVIAQPEALERMQEELSEFRKDNRGS